MSVLFSPYDLGPLPLRNRLVIAPMCQYSAENGNATDWHMIHLGQLALSGAGLLIIEGYGLTVTQWLPLEIPAHDATRRYLKTKKEKLGHKLSSV